MLTDGDIARIGQRIVAGCRPLVVGIFGSYALGTAHQRSDLDVFVIARSPGRPWARRRAVLRHLVGVLHPLDVQVFTPEEFEDEAAVTRSFVWIIARQARVLYPTEGAERLVPALRVERGAA